MINPLRCLGVLGGGRFGRTDLGVLKVALLVAALDGEVTDLEYEVFDRLAKKCRGYTPEVAEVALHEAMRSAGYLLVLSRRVSEAALVKAFVAEAKAALPNGFAFSSVDEVRRAMVLWITMGMSDGDYSERERKGIEALRKLFAETKVRQVLEDEERWRAISQDCGLPANPLDCPAGGSVTIVTRDFVGDVERQMAQYGDSKDAAKVLKSLIEG